MKKPVTQKTKRGNDCLKAALDYAERGWFVFPAPPGQKKSYLAARYSGGRKWGATNQARLIRRFYRKYPRANVGIMTGAISGFFVVEADTKSGHNVDGIAALKQLQAQHGPLPRTLQAVSPSGSLHFYFQHPGDAKIRNSASEIAPGIDTRGDGGMVLSPPSFTPSAGACYRWLNRRPLARAPTWLLDLLQRPERSISERAASLIRPNSRAVDRNDVRAALDVIARGCAAHGVWPYQPWLEIGCALYAEFGDAGFELFAAFSATAPTFNAASCRAKWRECTKFSAFTVGTIFFYADQLEPRWRAVHEARRLERAYSFFGTTCQ